MRPRRVIHRILVGLGVVAVPGVVPGALTVVHVVAPQRDGLLALSQVFAPYLFLLLRAVPAAVPARPGRRGRLLRC